GESGYDFGVIKEARNAILGQFWNYSRPQIRYWMECTLVNLFINAKGFFVHRREWILNGLIVSRNNQRILRSLGINIARACRASFRFNRVAGLSGGGSFISLVGNRRLVNY